MKYTEKKSKIFNKNKLKKIEYITKNNVFNKNQIYSKTNPI